MDGLRAMNMDRDALFQAFRSEALHYALFSTSLTLSDKRSDVQKHPGAHLRMGCIVNNGIVNIA